MLKPPPQFNLGNSISIESHGVVQESLEHLWNALSQGLFDCYVNQETVSNQAVRVAFFHFFNTVFVCSFLKEFRLGIELFNLILTAVGGVGINLKNFEVLLESYKIKSTANCRQRSDTK